MVNFEKAKEKLEDAKQLQILRFYDELNEDEKENLLAQIEKTDFSYIQQVHGKNSNGTSDSIAEQHTSAPVIAPISAMRLEEIEQKKSELEAAGIDALKQGKVAVVLLAGGQGSRLGWDGPKGTYNIGVTKNLYIFECLFNNIRQVLDPLDLRIPFLIMTSEINDAETRSFLKEHDFFGYGEENVDFFVQDMAPATDFEGRVLMASKGSISLSPNGNGGWFGSMDRAGLVKKLEEKGVQWLNLISVDNVLQKIADPKFIGAAILSGCESGSKVVGKASPDEKVGVMCLRDSKPSIVEYFELSDEMRQEREADGTLSYNWGVILNYLFRLDVVKRIEKNQLELHLSKKKIPYVNEDGEIISPEEPNGYKYEKLITDLIEMMDSCLPYEVEREKDFAPVKNVTGKDSVESARELMKLNGVEF